MTVEELWVDGKIVRSSEFGVAPRPIPLPEGGFNFNPQSAIGNPKSLLLTALALSNDACKDNAGVCLGDPTEAALLTAALVNGFEKQTLEKTNPRVAELPFDSGRKLMTTYTQSVSETVSSRQSPEVNTSPSPRAHWRCCSRPPTRCLRRRARSRSTGTIFSSVHDRMAAEGLRVMGIAMRVWDRMPDVKAPVVETNLTFLGLAGMMDPPREEAKKAVAECRTAGHHAGDDHRRPPADRPGIARRVGILEADDPRAVMTGAELEALSLDEFEKRVESIRVYARVAPEQKLKIVQALQDKGHFVAMTGDGVNDAPALKRADIGSCHGHHGHRRGQGGVVHDPARRQLRHDREGGEEKAGRSTTTSASSSGIS